MAAYQITGSPRTNPSTKTSPKKVPAYSLHKASGRGVVYLNSRTIYLGEYGTPDNLARYSHVIEQWNAGGAHAVGGRVQFSEDLTVAKLLARVYPLIAERYQPAELSAFSVATRCLLRLYADT